MIGPDRAGTVDAAGETEGDDVRAVQVVRLDGPAAVEVRRRARAGGGARPGARRRPRRRCELPRCPAVQGPLPVQARAALHARRPRSRASCGRRRRLSRCVRATGSSPSRARGVRRGRRGRPPTSPSAAGRGGFEEGAGLPMNYLTAHFALVAWARLREGQAVLVHGAAGGIGTAASSWPPRSARPSSRWCRATPRPRSRGRRARPRRARRRLPRRGEGAHGGGVDVVVDPVGGDRFTDSLRCLAPRGGCWSSASPRARSPR